jgi:hypothetical protein
VYTEVDPRVPEGSEEHRKQRRLADNRRSAAKSRARAEHETQYRAVRIAQLEREKVAKAAAAAAKAEEKRIAAEAREAKRAAASAEAPGKAAQKAAEKAERDAKKAREEAEKAERKAAREAKRAATEAPAIPLRTQIALSSLFGHALEQASVKAAGAFNLRTTIEFLSLRKVLRRHFKVAK